MKLTLLRHGTRTGIGDAPLDENGSQQARHLGQASDLSSVEHIYCSPKLRCQDTVAPLAKNLELTVQTLPDLDQMHQDEAPEAFVGRVERLLREHLLAGEQNPTHVLLCTHSDWIHAASPVFQDLSSQPSSHLLFSCAEYRTFTKVENTWSWQDPY